MILLIDITVLIKKGQDKKIYAWCQTTYMSIILWVAFNSSQCLFGVIWF